MIKKKKSENQNLIDAVCEHQELISFFEKMKIGKMYSITICKDKFIVFKIDNV